MVIRVNVRLVLVPYHQSDDPNLINQEQQLPDPTLGDNQASISSLSFLIVSGLFRVPRSAREIEPVSSETTTQMQFSTRSVIPMAHARWRVPNWREAVRPESGKIIPDDTIREPRINVAPSCSRVFG